VDADVAIRLADVFVPQFARRSRPPVSLPRDYLEKQGLDPTIEAMRVEQIASSWERLPPISALDLAVECREQHLILLGDPGAGKSALARYVLLNLLNDAETTGSPFAALTGHLPFLVELRDFVLREAEGRCADLAGYLAYFGRELGFGFDTKSLEEQFIQRPSLLIVDGLDEIFDPKRRRLMVDQIIGLAARYPKICLLVTSRVAGFDDSPFRAAEFSVATLIDLTAEQIESFASAWFTIVFPGDPSAATRARDDLLDAVRRRPQLRTLAGNPMILTIMATVARHKRLGRSRAALYAQALELLCYNWDYKRGLDLPPDSPLIDLQAEDTLLMLRRVAWRMQEAPDGLRANAIDDTALRGVIEDFFERDWHFETLRARRATSEMLERLQVRNWVLTLRGPALYGFVHRTFLEYLCALEVSERFKSQQIDITSLIATYVVPRIDNDTWREPLRLLLGLLPPAAAEQMILSVLSDEINVTTNPSRLVLGWQGLAEIEPRHIATLGNACKQLTKVLYAWLGATNDLTIAFEITDAVQSIDRIIWPIPHPPEAAWPPRALDDTHTYLHLIGVLGKTIWNCPGAVRDVIAAGCDDKEPYRRSAAALILSIQFPHDRRNSKIVRDLASTDSDAFVRQNAIECSYQYFRGEIESKLLLRERSLEDSSEDCRNTALRALAQYFREDPETKLLLRERALQDSADNCRASALQALAQYFREDPETTLLLRERALRDSGGKCRAAALRALAVSFGHDPETRLLLRERVVEDSDGDCRNAALHLLANSFGNDPETKRLLRERAVEDSAGDCRDAALRTLADSFGNDPGTKLLLRERAVADTDAVCRASAFLALAKMTGVQNLIRLASRDLDGEAPGRDPRQPIKLGLITEAAEELGETELGVRALYDRLAEEIPLIIAPLRQLRKRRS
jgi:hypothetical protein